ncbi:hypothetical protein EV182_008511, partial [Spiromyces aspiralis]
ASISGTVNLDKSGAVATSSANRSPGQKASASTSPTRNVSQPRMISESAAFKTQFAPATPAIRNPFLALNQSIHIGTPSPNHYNKKPTTQPFAAPTFNVDGPTDKPATAWPNQRLMPNIGRLKPATAIAAAGSSGTKRVIANAVANETRTKEE